MIIKINKAIGLFVFIMFFVLLIFSDKVTAGVKNGIDLSLNILIPTLLPFTTLSLMFIKCDGLMLLSKIIGLKLSIWLLSSIGGYPAGALIINELKGKVDDSFLKKAVLYSVNAGPSFVIAAVGSGIFNNINIGLLLLFSHIFISLLFCIFSKSAENKIILTPTFCSPAILFFESLEKALISIMKICGTVIFITSVFELIKTIPFINHLSLIFEVTVGIAKSNKNLYFIGFLLSFSGFSVIMQVKMILKDLISFKTIVLYRLLHGVLTALLLFVITLIFPITIETISNGISFSNRLSYLSISSGIALIFMCIVFITQILRQKNNREAHG